MRRWFEIGMTYAVCGLGFEVGRRLGRIGRDDLTRLKRQAKNIARRVLRTAKKAARPIDETDLAA